MANRFAKYAENTQRPTLPRGEATADNTGTKGETRPVKAADLKAALGVSERPQAEARRPLVGDRKASGGLREQITRTQRPVTPAGDVAASVALSGLPKGVAGVFGGVGDAYGMAQAAGDWLADRTGIDARPVLRKATKDIPVIGGVVRAVTEGNPFVTSAQINAAVQSVAGEYHKPQTTAGRYSERVAEFVPNAFGPGGAIRKTAQVVIPAVASQGAGDAAKAVGFGEKGQAAAEVAGALVGSVAAARPLKLPGTASQQRPVLQLEKAAPQDVGAMRARQLEYEAAGVRPTLVDVVDEGGRGYLSGAALRMPARPAARAYADQKRVGLPDRVTTHANRFMSDDPRTPMQIAEELAAARNAAADQAFSAVRNEALEMAPETVQALRTPIGKSAIAEAAKRERDPEVRAALLRLSDDALDNPSTLVTVGMMDRVSRVLKGQADAAARAGDNDLASTFGGLARSVREPARQAVPGYGRALDEYEAGSRILAAAERGEDFLKRDTDGFVADLADFGTSELPLARATGRRAVERAVGENPAAAPGVAERLAIAPEQQARNAALLGPDDAQRLQDAMRLEVESFRNAQRISPTVGSPTAPKNVAAGVVSGAVDTGVSVASLAHGNPLPAVGQAVKLLKAKGLNDRQAARLVEMATDPDQLDDVLIILEARIGRQGAQEFLRLAAPALPALATSTALE